MIGKGVKSPFDLCACLPLDILGKGVKSPFDLCACLSLDILDIISEFSQYSNRFKSIVWQENIYLKESVRYFHELSES